MKAALGDIANVDEAAVAANVDSHVAGAQKRKRRLAFRQAGRALRGQAHGHGHARRQHTVKISVARRRRRRRAARRALGSGHRDAGPRLGPLTRPTPPAKAALERPKFDGSARSGLLPEDRERRPGRSCPPAPVELTFVRLTADAGVAMPGFMNLGMSPRYFRLAGGELSGCRCPPASRPARWPGSTPSASTRRCPLVAASSDSLADKPAGPTSRARGHGHAQRQR